MPKRDGKEQANTKVSGSHRNPQGFQGKEECNKYNNSSGSSHNNSSFEQKLNQYKRGPMGKQNGQMGQGSGTTCVMGLPTMRRLQKLQEKACNISKTIALKCMDIQSTIVLKCVSVCSTKIPNETLQGGKLDINTKCDLFQGKIRVGSNGVSF